MKYSIKVMDKIIHLDAYYPMLKTRMRPYLVSEQTSPDLVISFNEEYIKKIQADHPNLSLDEAEYIYTSSKFYDYILDYDAFMLHGSAVKVGDRCFIFSGNSGAGKSTHTSLYLKHFEGAEIINDDKPLIKIEGNQAYIYGSPWSGKNDLSSDQKVLLQAISFVKQSLTNQMRIMNTKEAVYNLLNQTIRPVNKDKYSQLLDDVNVIVSNYKVYELKCDISYEAACFSYETMLGKKEVK